jgi:NAD(P)-dependent dehydrogenase (short-subunit alcohol dehydrogenase family)
MSKLMGKTALVTGGGSGIGLACARQLLEQGARVAITGRNAEKLRAAAEGVGAGDRLLWHAADVTDPVQVDRLVRDATARLGRIDVLVNNAGLNVKERALRELKPESWRQLVAGNLDGAFYCIRAVLPQMRERHDGLIININSISGKRANPLGGLGYIAAKFGLRGLALGVAAEEKASGIRVSSIYPGEVNTPILEARPSPVSAERKQAMLQPEDVAAAVLFLATLPPHAVVPELVITPANAPYV